MQCALIEFARNAAGIAKADSEELDELSPEKVIHLMAERHVQRHSALEKRDIHPQNGERMRLGAHPCLITPNTRAWAAYGVERIDERHRHRYAFNNAYLDRLSEKGMIFSGQSPDKELAEIIELSGHPWFLGCQFHPEFKSSPMKPHPLFKEFIKAAKENAK
jgi:CTP synthase